MIQEIAAASSIKNDKVLIVMRIVLGLLIIFIVYRVFKIIMNVLRPIEKITESSEEKQERLDEIENIKALSPFYFTKYYKKESDIKKYLNEKGLSYSAINKISDNLWNKGFGRLSDDEEYIYQQIRNLPSLIAVSMLSYNLKQRYEMGLDELITRNLSEDEQLIIAKILNKKPLK